MKNGQVEAYKKEFEQQFQGDKSRRIQKEYNLRLLR